MTRWAKKVTASSPLNEYPRPQFTRAAWMNLNGLWDYAITPRSQSSPGPMEGKILVPFPVESALSGVMRRLGPGERLWYRHSFTIPNAWKDKKILLHFGAVDWESTISINGVEIGCNKGGHVPFSFDITSPVNFDGENTITVSVWDPTGRGNQERGKQALKPMFYFYTAVSGIWQTVWLEPVHASHFATVKIITDIDARTVSLKPVIIQARADDTVEICISDGRSDVHRETMAIRDELTIDMHEAQLWSPETPHLYSVSMKLARGGEVIDEFGTYFGMRKINIVAGASGVQRVRLNNAAIFQSGVLDQGWWPDGLYTAPTDEALRFDIEKIKDFGFNMIRKHVKIEPARWYHHCDTLGMLVWQDMPSGGRFFGLGRRSKRVRQDYYNELFRMLEYLRNAPCVVVWVPFNEGWGQFETRQVTEQIKARDPTRLVDSASGWFDKKTGDIQSSHVYPGMKMPRIKSGLRALALSEFGGIGLNTAGHVWPSKRYFAYKTVVDSEKFARYYESIMNPVVPLVENGLSAVIYTQLTDVEREINGLLTYDREVTKLDATIVKAINARLIETGRNADSQGAIPGFQSPGKQ